MLLVDNNHLNNVLSNIQRIDFYTKILNRPEYLIVDKIRLIEVEN